MLQTGEGRGRGGRKWGTLKQDGGSWCGSCCVHGRGALCHCITQASHPVFFGTPAPPAPISTRTVRVFLTVSFLLFFPGWDETPCMSSTFGLTTTTTTKSLQSCLTLCDPIDGSPPGSPVPGILQARTLEWVAISFSNA